MDLWVVKYASRRSRIGGEGGCRLRELNRMVGIGW